MKQLNVSIILPLFWQDFIYFLHVSYEILRGFPLLKIDLHTQGKGGKQYATRLLALSYEHWLIETRHVLYWSDI